MNPFICVIPGDGCGQEVTAESIRVLDLLKDHLSFEYEVHDAGAEYYLKTGRAWDKETIECARGADAILFGAVGKEGVRKPDGTTLTGEVIFGLRNGLDLYANVRPIRLFPGIQQRLSRGWGEFWRPEDVDIVIVRENTEGLYVRIGGIAEGVGVALDNRLITEKGSKRITEFAAKVAMKRDGHLTCVDKSNVLIGDRYFRENFKQVIDNYRENSGRVTDNKELDNYEIDNKDFDKESVKGSVREFTSRTHHASHLRTDFYYVDAFAMRLLTDPQDFDVVVTPNLYGDILTDMGAVLQGGLGMASSGNYGEKNAMFEPVHGSAPDIAGKGIVNPSASFLSLSMLLNYIGEKGADDSDGFVSASRFLEEAVVGTIASGTKTPDLGGKAGTREFADRVRTTFRSHLKDL